MKTTDATYVTVAPLKLQTYGAIQICLLLLLLLLFTIPTQQLLSVKTTE